jgi:hypothetical protein
MASWQGPITSRKSNLSCYRDGLTAEGIPGRHFEDSKDQYPPGFDAESIDVDDLRLESGSPAEQHGVILADPQIGIDDPSAPPDRPDIGCFRADDPGLRVGVDGRRRFPELPAET